MVVLCFVCVAFLTAACMHIFNYQYMLSSGKGYDYYGLMLSSATLVPLQGFWNSFVYIRPRYSRYIASSSSRMRSSIMRSNRSSMMRSNTSNVNEVQVNND